MVEHSGSPAVGPDGLAPLRKATYPEGVEVLWLIITAVVALAAGAVLGWATARSLGRPGDRPGAMGGLLSDDAVIPVLAALRSTVIVLDDDDEVLRASASAYTYNLVRDDAVCVPDVADMVARVRADGEPREQDITVARGRVAGSGHFFLHVRVASIGQGRVLVLVEDHSAAKRLEEMRRDLVANISHELKTPVGAIALLAETIEDSAEDAGLVTGFAARMRTEATRLGVLVQDVIELSRVQDGDALVSPEDVDVDAVVAESVDRVRVEAEARSITVVSGGTSGLMVRGDASLIVTAVRNLLDNALRYSEPRTRVSVGVSLDHLDPGLVRIAVVDQGIGIAPEDQGRVFERFYRVDRARSRATGGTGLGLAIVKHVAANHGGTIELWSAPGRGSTFTLVLPRVLLGEGTGRLVRHHEEGHDR